MTYEVRDHVAHVRFTRPEGANAVNPAFSADLRTVMVAIEFDDEVRAVSVTAEGKVFCAGGDLVERFRRRRAGHAAQDAGVGMLERDVEVGQDQPLCHQRDQIADVRVWVDVVQADPGAEAAEVARQIGDMGAVAAIFRVADVDSVS